MRDGIKLFTSVYAPKDSSRQYPILLLRTPYSVGPYGSNTYRFSLGPSDSLARDGFMFVYQDVRGRFMSEGEFIDEAPHKAHLDGTNDVDPSTDTYDTIDWLIKNMPNNNGRVGMWGVSYPGFYAAYGLVNSHPALQAVSPQAPMGDVGNGYDVMHNGAFFSGGQFRFFHRLLAARGFQARRASRESRKSLRVRNERSIRFLFAHGSAGQRRRPLLQTSQPVLERLCQAPELRRVLGLARLGA